MGLCSGGGITQKKVNDDSKTGLSGLYGAAKENRFLKSHFQLIINNRKTL